MKARKNTYSRFYTRRLPLSFGLMIALVGGFFLVNTVLAMMTDESVILLLVSAVMALLLAAATALGLLAVCAALETLVITPQGIRLRLGPVTLLRIPRERIRSVVATTKEYREKWDDRRVYLLKIYAFDGVFCNIPLWIQWSDKTEEALRACFPDVNYLL